MKTEFLTGKKVLVMGLGRFGGGLDIAKFAATCGATVTVTDLATHDQLADSISQLKEFTQIKYHLSSHNPADFSQADIIVANPAIAPENEFLKIAKDHNKLITSQINIFLELCPALIIGITGANGKSTTAALTAHLLKAGLAQKDFKYSNVWLSGNIGNVPLLESLDQMNANDLVVLELSSFQLEQLVQIKKAPKVALLTNLTPNHLDRHGTFENYCDAKENIFKLQQPDENCPPISIFNAEDKIGIEWFEKYSKEKARICLKFSPEDISQEIRDNFLLPGRANLSNLAAAVTIAKYFGLNDEQIKSHLPEFKSLPHRLELVARTNDIDWYNDSIATTPQSTIAAIEAFQQPKVIIAGGYDKNLPFDQLGEKIAKNAKATILIGQTAQKIAKAIEKHPENQTKIAFADSLAQAVDLAASLATRGDVVLLSPACASYDMFDNFQHRGQAFIRLVQKINT